MKIKTHINITDRLFLNIGIILVILGIVFFGLGVFMSPVFFLKIMLFISAFIFFVNAGIFLYISNTKENKEKSLFSLDPEMDIFVEDSDLNFESVCRWLDMYIPIYVYHDAKDEWFDSKVIKRCKDLPDKLMVKLIYLRMLYVWINDATDRDFVKIGSLTKEEVDYIVEFMSDLGEKEISAKLKNLSSIYGGDTRELMYFFYRKKEYLRNTIVNHVKSHIENL